MSKIILECKNIRKDFRIGSQTLTVLKDVNLVMPERSWLMLLGASGSGKTTLLNILGTLERPDSGELNFDGRPYSEFNQVALRNREIGFVFQSYHLLPELTVLENIMLPAYLGKNFSCKARALSLAERVGLKDRLAHRPGELSGGECQRAAIARALINSPRLLLADEPTGNLDAATGDGIMKLLAELHGDKSIPLSIIMITHNPDLAKLGDASCELVDGQLRKR
ncbi:MAG: ABC transporter ATP-binding protein [Victivallaceae bacterium]|nr:ABC transporter ATP-binding protein [Victivallaceae bacterium]